MEREIMKGRSFNYYLKYGGIEVNTCIGGGRLIFTIDFIDNSMARRKVMVIQFMKQNLCKAFISDNRGLFHFWGIKKQNSQKAINKVLEKVNLNIKKQFKPHELPGNQL
jgi:ABC-type ATPase involved in cell division